MANGERFNVIVRRTDAMRRLSDGDRCAAIAAASNIAGFERFAPRATQVRVNEAAAAVCIYHPDRPA